MKVFRISINEMRKTSRLKKKNTSPFSPKKIPAFQQGFMYDTFQPYPSVSSLKTIGCFL